MWVLQGRGDLKTWGGGIRIEKTHSGKRLDTTEK